MSSNEFTADLKVITITIKLLAEKKDFSISLAEIKLSRL